MWKELRKGFNKAKVTADANSARFEVRSSLSLSPHKRRATRALARSLSPLP